MIHCLYDGTFEGFLTVIAPNLENIGEVAAISISEPEQTDLFTTVLPIKTDPDLAQEFYQKLAAHLYPAVLTDLVNCFLSEEAGIEMVLFQYIALLLARGEKTASNYADPLVLKIRKLSEQVGHEIHRFHGFVRFRLLPGGVYYAAIEPDYNIVQFLAPHFSARFADQSWLIHDLKRKSGIYYDGRQCVYLPAVSISSEFGTASVPGDSGLIKDVFGVSEFEYQELWRQYFREIAIRERENPKAQRQRMPERYWRHLVERVKE